MHTVVVEGEDEARLISNDELQKLLASMGQDRLLQALDDKNKTYVCPLSSQCKDYGPRTIAVLYRHIQQKHFQGDDAGFDLEEILEGEEGSLEVLEALKRREKELTRQGGGGFKKRVRPESFRLMLDGKQVVCGSGIGALERELVQRKGHGKAAFR